MSELADASGKSAHDLLPSYIDDVLYGPPNADSIIKAFDRPQPMHVPSGARVVRLMVARATSDILCVMSLNESLVVCTHQHCRT